MAEEASVPDSDKADPNAEGLTVIEVEGSKRGYRCVKYFPNRHGKQYAARVKVDGKRSDRYYDTQAEAVMALVDDSLETPIYAPVLALEAQQKEQRERAQGVLQGAFEGRKNVYIP
jgi:hypothetical protein